MCEAAYSVTITPTTAIVNANTTTSACATAATSNIPTRTQTPIAPTITRAINDAIAASTIMPTVSKSSTTMVKAVTLTTGCSVYAYYGDHCCGSCYDASDHATFPHATTPPYLFLGGQPNTYPKLSHTAPPPPPPMHLGGGPVSAQLARTSGQGATKFVRRGSPCGVRV